jgi:hypothetical protein
MLANPSPKAIVNLALRSESSEIAAKKMRAGINLPSFLRQKMIFMPISTCRPL